MYVCVHNGTVYIYSRISGEKRQKAEEILCFRLDTILWVFLCAHIAHKQDRDEERERGGKTCEAAGKQHQLLNIEYIICISYQIAFIQFYVSGVTSLLHLS